MIYLELFISFFQVGLFSFGGGYAAMPLINEIVVVSHGWITVEKFADIITISGMAPGSIAINAATFVGIEIAGFPGGIVSAIGCMLPSFIIVIIFAYLYTKYREMTHVKNLLTGLRPAIVGLIASSGATLAVLSFFPTVDEGFFISFISVLIFAMTLFVLRKFKINAIIMMLASGVIGLVLFGFFGFK